MRRFVAGVVMAVFFTAAVSTLGFCKELKIGFVDLSRVFDDYQKTKEFDKALSEKQKNLEAEIERRSKDIKQLQDTMAVLSDKEKEKRQSDIDAKIKALEEYGKSVGGDLRKERDDKIKDILKDIEKVIKDIASKDGYDLVLNDRVLVYDNKDNKALDLTDRVVQAVNSGYKK